MKPPFSWLTNLISRALAPDERDSVLGDLAESGDSELRVLFGVLGLILRRAVAPWNNWHPWLGLFGLALPLSMTLCFEAFYVERGSDLYLWIARNYATIDTTYLERSGLALRHGVWNLIAGSMLMISWSWIAGFVLGTLSRGAIWLNGAIFCLIAAYLDFIEIGMSRRHPYQYSIAGWGLPLAFYTVILPVFMLTVLVFLPSLRGIYRSRRTAISRAWLLCIAAIVLVATAIHPPFRSPGLAGLLVPAGYWPVGYLIVNATFKGKATS